MSATSGIPDNQFGNDGSLAIDVDDGTPYVKFNGAWATLSSVLSGVSASNTGSGSPEGVVTASPGGTYFDTSADSLWYKKTGTGNTGWVQLL